MNTKKTRFKEEQVALALRQAESGMAVITIAALLTVQSAGWAADEPEPSVAEAIAFVPDVETQFASLAVRPEGLAFSIGTSREPEVCKHYQSISRRQGQGTPYLFVSKSGNRTITCPLSDDELGSLLIVQMGSRDVTGERLRSNRLRRGWDIRGSDHEAFGRPWPTPPDPRDRTVVAIDFDGTGHWPAYRHPGGMQIVGDILAVPLETPYGPEPQPANLILFVDLSSPEAPVPVSKFDPGSDSGFKAGLVGLTPLADGRYLMIVTGDDNTEVCLFRSIANTPGGTDLRSDGVSWEELERWSEGQIESCLGADWHTGSGDAHQNLDFVRHSDLDGPLYLIGTRNDTKLPSGDDFVDLYRVHVDALGEPYDCLLTHMQSKHLTSHPIIGGGDSANLAAPAALTLVLQES